MLVLRTLTSTEGAASPQRSCHRAMATAVKHFLLLRNLHSRLREMSDLPAATPRSLGAGEHQSRGEGPPRPTRHPPPGLGAQSKHTGPQGLPGPSGEGRPPGRCPPLRARRLRRGRGATYAGAQMLQGPGSQVAPRTGAPRARCGTLPQPHTLNCVVFRNPPSASSGADAERRSGSPSSATALSPNHKGKQAN